MDITMLFKACVKTQKTRSKALGIETDLDKNRILKSKRKSEFTSKSKDIINQITQLRDFLLEHRKSYLNFSSSFNTSEKITDAERDKIDVGAQQIIKSCSQLISVLKKELYLVDDVNQALEHQKSIVDSIEVYLKTVCSIYSEQKAIRVKWIVELQKVSKLESDKNTVTTTREEKLHEVADKRNTYNFNSDDGDDNPLSEEELQMFEIENEMLYNELNSLSDEVREIQSKVVHITELQEVFTEKVLEQNEDIERINSTLVGTTENLKDANTQIRQAIQSNAGLRIYILFFLLVMSFTLLFLDWYNE